MTQIPNERGVTGETGVRWGRRVRRPSQNSGPGWRSVDGKGRRGPQFRVGGVFTDAVA